MVQNHQISITPGDVHVSGNDVTISSPSLLKGLVIGQASTLQFLGRIAALSLSDIDIDNQGRVVIRNNPGFAQGAAAAMSTGPKTGNNCNC